MFDRHYHIQDEHSRVEAARINALSQEKFAKQLKDISEAEIKSKDRVDITLAEYERLKSENARLQQQVDRLSKTIVQIGIPAEILDHIIPSSVKVACCDDYYYFKKRYQVVFDVEDSPDIHWRVK